MLHGARIQIDNHEENRVRIAGRSLAIEDQIRVVGLEEPQPVIELERAVFAPDAVDDADEISCAPSWSSLDTS
jgi:hypothetical protein